MIRARLKHRVGDFEMDMKLDVPPGVTALLGPSGAGKSTCLNLLLGLEALTAGEVWWNSDLLEQAPGGPRATPESRRFGAVFQDGLLFPHLTVEQNIAFGMGRGQGRGSHDEVERWLLELHLEPLRHRRPDTLSGGERQRVAIARALAPRPRALLLDEPLRGLDPRLKRETLLVLRRLRRELDLPVLYVTHEPAEALALADRAVVMEAGRLVWGGEPAGLLDREPGLGLAEPANFLDVEVLTQGPGGLAELRWGPYRLRAETPAAPGSRLTVTMMPSDLVLGIGIIGCLSPRNRLQMKVHSITRDRGTAWVRFQAPGPFFARVTLEAAQELGLAAGQEVTVLIKALAVRRGGPF